MSAYGHTEDPMLLIKLMFFFVFVNIYIVMTMCYSLKNSTLEI